MRVSPISPGDDAAEKLPRRAGNLRPSGDVLARRNQSAHRWRRNADLRRAAEAEVKWL